MADFFNIRARQAAAAAQAASASSSKNAPPTVDDRLQPWVEKYRPKSLDDVAAQDNTITVLRRTLQSSNLPHMLFYGPPGTGKTSTILALAKQLYGPQLIKSRVLELNASDERGISIVREKVKNFARMQLSNPPAGPAGEEYKKKYPCPPYKIIILDEADSMTQDAQSALRRTMETYSKITRFCLVCNYVTRIIDPLASRCSKFRFKPLDEGNAGRRLEDIAKLEGVQLEDGAVDALLRCSEGDLRKAITFLQSASRLIGSGGNSNSNTKLQSKKRKRTSALPEDSEADSSTEMDIDSKPTTTATSKTQAVSTHSIEEIAGVIPSEAIDPLLNTLLELNPNTKASPFSKLQRTVRDLTLSGYSATQLVGQLYAGIVEEGESIGNRERGACTLLFSEADERLVDGADEELVVLDLVLSIAGILRGTGKS